MILHLFLAPPGFLNSSWVQVDAGHITGADISAWPSCVGILVRFTSFLGTTLHWPSCSVDLGSFWDLLFGTFNPFRAIGWTPDRLVKRLLDLI